MSEKCDLCHLKLAVFLSTFQAFAFLRDKEKYAGASFVRSGDNEEECRKDEILFQGNYHTRHQHNLSK